MAGNEQPEQAVPDLTYGQQAVGLKFNPSGDDNVSKVKQSCADLIDLVESTRTPNDSRLANSLKTYAVTAVIAAQMAVVKVLTWKD